MFIGVSILMDTDAHTIAIGYPSDNKLLGKSFQKPARGPAESEARKGAGVHWCIYTNGHLSPCGFRDSRKGIGVRQVLVLNTT